MKRIYVCIGIVVLLLAAAFYSSFRVQQFAEDISDDIDTAMEDIRNSDLTGARQALAEGAELCDTMREGMNHLLRTQDFTELEAALRAAAAALEQAGGRVLFAEAESYPCASSDIRSGKLPPEKWPEVLPQEALAVIRKNQLYGSL